MKRLILCILLLVPAVVQIQARKLTLKAFFPEVNKDSAAVIVCPGGSYFWLSRHDEGTDVAKWLADNGIAAYVLDYRTAGWSEYLLHGKFLSRGIAYPAPQEDLLAALEQVRQECAARGIRPDRVGVMGFSAGGHLALCGGEMPQFAGTRPSFIAAIYPVVTMTDQTIVHKRSRRGLLGDEPKETRKKAALFAARADTLSMERHVGADMPPVFLLNCRDDDVVDYRNGVKLEQALRAAEIKYQYTLFKAGGHGFGVDPDKMTEETSQWQELFLNWLRNLFD